MKDFSIIYKSFVKKTKQFLKKNKKVLKKKITRVLENIKTRVNSFKQWSQHQKKKYLKKYETYKFKKNKKKEFLKKKKQEKIETEKRKWTQFKGRINEIILKIWPHIKDKIYFLIGFFVVVLMYGYLVNYVLNFFFELDISLRAAVAYGIIVYFIKYELTNFINSIKKQEKQTNFYEGRK